MGLKAGERVTLRQLLDNPRSDLRVWLDRRLGQLGPVRSDWKSALAGSEPLLPTVGSDGSSPNYSLLGHAIGQRIQWMLTPGVSEAVLFGLEICIATRVVALDAAKEIRSVVDDPCFGERLSSAELARWALLTGLMEQTYRAGPRVVESMHPEQSLDSLLSSFATEAVTDVQQVAARCEPIMSEMSPDGDEVVVGPCFAGSNAVGGADADFVIGRSLVDVKATKKTSLSKRDIQQLVMYALLDFDHRYSLESVAILLARFGVMVRWDLDELLPTLAGEPVSVFELQTEVAGVLGAS